MDMSGLWLGWHQDASRKLFGFSVQYSRCALDFHHNSRKSAIHLVNAPMFSRAVITHIYGR